MQSLFVHSRAGKGMGTGTVGRDEGGQDGRGEPFAKIRPESRLAKQKYVPSRPTIYTEWNSVLQDATGQNETWDYLIVFLETPLKEEL